MIQKLPKIVIPSVDLGGTKIAFAFLSVDEDRRIVREYPPTEVVKRKGRTDADSTLKLIAKLIKERTREAEKKGWVVLKLVGMGAPGVYLEDGSVDPRSVPHNPGLAKIKPADVLEGMLGKAWSVYINNDGVVQAVASANAFVRSPDYARRWRRIVDGTGGKVIYFGPGTGFGAGKIVVRQDEHVEPIPGSQAFFDIVIRDNKTAEDLIGGNGIGKMAQRMEQANIQKGKSVFLKFTEGYD
jgi:predicted NBD/HSP70 family sugar kinase